jgi:hypothetical protein
MGRDRYEAAFTPSAWIYSSPLWAASAIDLLPLRHPGVMRGLQRLERERPAAHERVCNLVAALGGGGRRRSRRFSIIGIRFWRKPRTAYDFPPGGGREGGKTTPEAA